MFNPIRIDKGNAIEIISKLKFEQKADLVGKRFEGFWKHGYCFIPDWAPIAAVDRYLEQFQVCLRAGKFKVSFGLDVISTQDAEPRKPLTKIWDTYIHSQAAQEMAFAAPIKTFLERMFGYEALAFQELHFDLGSTQAVHQDIAYVVVDKPKSLTAVWIALEDIEPGPGELVYYPGSHRFGDFLYLGDRKNWSLGDSSATHNHHIYWLHEEASDETFRLKASLQKRWKLSYLAC